MRKVEFPEHHTDVWLSDDQLEDFQTLSKEFKGVAGSLKEELGRHLDSLLNIFDGYEKEYAELFMRSVGKPNIACLVAHGGTGTGRWVFTDGEQTRKVQSWIDRREKDYGLIILCCCNEGAITPKSRHALLFVPDSDFSIAKVEVGVSHFSLIHPTKGELEHVIEYELAELRRTLEGTT